MAAAPSVMTGLELPSAQALQSSEQMALLNAVDDLRAHGLGEITALPQLVVCGDQSSGKSSVLEAISGIPFPRKANTCTRFATEVILRRARTVRMSVSIVPSQDLPRLNRERILAFRHDLASLDGFADLFERAKETMGIADSGKAFSKDVLRVELCGPTQPQLTLVDLPGLIHAATDKQIDADVELINDLVGSYLKSPATIILAIISARYDVNNQVILRLARQVDPQGKRTLGIITKPDTIVDAEDERQFIKTASNENVRFVLGWHVVKNLPSRSEDADQGSRDEKEVEFFQTSAFSSLPRGCVGITSLRSRLSSVLFDQIKTELPRLVTDIESRVQEAKAAQKRLGPSRSTAEEQREFLTEMSEMFQIICRDAVAGHYDHEFFRGDVDGERRLCANLMNKHFKFAKSLRKRGALWKVVSDAETEKNGSVGDEEEDEEDDEVDDDDDDEDDEVDDDDDDEAGDEDEDARTITRQDAIKAACRVLKLSRGRELPGLPNPLLVGELFREYSRPWAGLARFHITDVWNATNAFLEIVLQYLTDDDVRDKILRHWLDPIMGKSLELAKEKLEELLEVHKDHPLTTNRDFIKNRNDLQQERSQEDRVTDMDLVAAEDAFDNMNAYYKVAMNLFMDNVPTLAVQAPIVRKLPAMLSPRAVSKMDGEIIKKIAGESAEKVRKREETLLRLEKLESGARICKEYASRPNSIARRSEGSSNAATPQSPAQRRAEKGKGRETADRPHSASVSEDGRGPSRNLERASDPRGSVRLGDELNVPSATPIRRPASADPPLGAQGIVNGPAQSRRQAPGFTSSPFSTPNGETVFGNPSNTREAFVGTGGFGGLGPSTTATGHGKSRHLGSNPSKATSSTSDTSVFGGLGNSTMATARTKKGAAETRPRMIFFEPSDFEKMKRVSKAPNTSDWFGRGMGIFQNRIRIEMNGDKTFFDCITIDPPLVDFSFEELRLADYADGHVFWE